MKGPSAQLLVVSPDATVLRVVRQCAVSLGHIAMTATSLAQARRAFVRASVDLLCLDSLLPPGETASFWRWLSAAADCSPRLLLLAPQSAKVAQAALPTFFQHDRDGLVAKPLHGDEVARELTRVLATDVRRRREADILRAGHLALDTTDHALYFGSSSAVSLTPTEFRLVRYLIEHPGEFIGVDELLEEVWGYAPDTGGAEVVRSHVNNLRRKIRSAGEDSQVIRNIPYRGYAVLAEQ